MLTAVLGRGRFPNLPQQPEVTDQVKSVRKWLDGLEKKKEKSGIISEVSTKMTRKSQEKPFRYKSVTKS